MSRSDEQRISDILEAADEPAENRDRLSLSPGRGRTGVGVRQQQRSDARRATFSLSPVDERPSIRSGLTLTLGSTAEYAASGVVEPDD